MSHLNNCLNDSFSYEIVAKGLLLYFETHKNDNFKLAQIVCVCIYIYNNNYNSSLQVRIPMI